MSVRDSISHPALLGLYDHWRSLAPLGEVPSWRGFDPVAVAPCIGWLLLADIEHDPLRVRYRLFGERLISLYGQDLTGRDVGALYMPDFRASLLDAYGEVVARRDARYELVKFPTLSSKYDYHRLMVPFRRGGPAVDTVMAGVFPVAPKLQHADHWRYDDEVRTFVRLLEQIDDGATAG
jgi:hypothetical protein